MVLITNTIFHFLLLMTQIKIVYKNKKVWNQHNKNKLNKIQNLFVTIHPMLIMHNTIVTPKHPDATVFDPWVRAI